MRFWSIITIYLNTIYSWQFRIKYICDEYMIKKFSKLQDTQFFTKQVQTTVKFSAQVIMFVINQNYASVIGNFLLFILLNSSRHFHLKFGPTYQFVQNMKSESIMFKKCITEEMAEAYVPSGWELLHVPSCLGLSVRENLCTPCRLASVISATIPCPKVIF